MNTQNTLSEEHLTSQGAEVNNKENYRQMNLDYLTNQIKYLGFGEGHKDALLDLMENNNDKIDFSISKEFTDSQNSSHELKPIDFTLHLNKGKESDMYFLNSYTAQFTSPDANPENSQSQKFYLNKGKGFTAKEAFNLLFGRAVNKDMTNKEGVTYNAWVKLKPAEANSEKGNRDFQIFSENYGFDLKETLSKYPIKEMETPEAADRLMASLKKGNSQSVTFIQNGEESTKYISANPQFKNLSIHNQDGTVMFHNNIEMNKKQNSQTQTAIEQNDVRPVMKVVKSPGMKR